ncbi:MAG: tyrosine-type recombinase/integrase [Clostridia bacterium]|nr:tyrosine-type recombinase/integrase [Clostridia bacterium]
MRTDALEKDAMDLILALLTPTNCLVCEVAFCTGLRLTDVLSIKTEQLARSFTVQEQKTGKRKRVYLPKNVYEKCLEMCGKTYLFPNRLNGRKHRTRQAVWKDIKRVGDMLKLKGNVAPHSLRKSYARSLHRKGWTDAQIQKALNHSDVAVTLLYAYANEVGVNRCKNGIKH